MLARADASVQKLLRMSPDAAAASWPAPPIYYRQPRRPPPPPPTAAQQITLYGVAQPALGTPPPPPELEQQVYPAGTADVCGELRKLNRSLLNSFVELLQVAQDAPTQSDQKLGDIRALLLNLMHLANSLRPYQAREDLIGEMERRLAERAALIREMGEARAAATEGIPAAAEEADVAGAEASGAAGAEASARGGAAAAPPGEVARAAGAAPAAAEGAGGAGAGGDHGGDALRRLLERLDQAVPAPS